MKFNSKQGPDKKHSVSFSFELPLWLTESYKHTTYFFRKWKYKMFPDHCDLCGTKMYVTNYQLELQFKYHRLLVENRAYNKEASRMYHICRHCLAKELERNLWEPRFSRMHKERGWDSPTEYWTAPKCDVTGNKIESYKSVEIYPYVDMMFCTNAWNSSYVSKEAVIECVKNGKVRTNRFAIEGRYMVSVNSRGLKVNEEGELI